LRSTSAVLWTSRWRIYLCAKRYPTQLIASSSTQQLVTALYGAITANATTELLTSDVHISGLENYYPYNPAKARSLLAAAGYPNGFSVNNFIVYGGWSNVAGAIAQDLAAVGVTVHENVTPTFGQWASAIGNNTTGGIVLYGYNAMPTYQVYEQLFAPGQSFNNLGGGWTDGVLSRLWSEGASAVKPQSDWNKLVTRITTQAFVVPILDLTGGYAYNAKKVAGVVDDPQLYVDPSEWSPAR
jgi:peptide/nickel transport system substrate-binding protein